MKAIVALLFLSALALYAQAEMEYHPHAILNYLEREDHEMVRKVRGILKLQDPGLSFKPSFKPSFEPSFKPSFKPSFEPSFKPLVPLPIKKCLAQALICHHKAKEDACEHLKCIKLTGCCLKETGIKFNPPPIVKRCLPVIPCCMLGSETCEEKLCCFVRFGECLKKLGDKIDA